MVVWNILCWESNPKKYDITEESEWWNLKVDISSGSSKFLHDISIGWFMFNCQILNDVQTIYNNLWLVSHRFHGSRVKSLSIQAETHMHNCYVRWFTHEVIRLELKPLEFDFAYGNQECKQKMIYSA